MCYDSLMDFSKDPEAKSLFDIFLNAWFNTDDAQEAGESGIDEDDPEVDPEAMVMEAGEEDAWVDEGAEDQGDEALLDIVRLRIVLP